MKKPFRIDGDNSYESLKKRVQEVVTLEGLTENNIIAGQIWKRRDGKLFRLTELCHYCKDYGFTAILEPINSGVVNCPSLISLITKFTLVESGSLSEEVKFLNNGFAKEIHFFSQAHKMEINGMGKSMVVKLVESGLVRSLPEIYTLPDRLSELVELPGIGEKKALELIENINHSKEKATPSNLYWSLTKEVRQGPNYKKLLDEFSLVGIDVREIWNVFFVNESSLNVISKKEGPIHQSKALEIAEGLLETYSKVWVEDNLGNVIFDTRLASLRKITNHLEELGLIK
ncbi:helix-hairpin-helix domain-containing protein [Marinomonas sp. TI.3.20]|uniref:helix-hairpin-helix domain-containing protein n=1 Tax=Marinomonas sp. TI.3.20 TaxID=3121296 RepID=UPI00311F9FD6